MIEEWKDIEGHEGIYNISNTGRIKSYKQRVEGKILKNTEDIQGYLNVKLYTYRVCKTVRVHRLVAKAFIENPDGKETVNHRDGNKGNNCVNNLEWMTMEENNRHAEDVLHKNKGARNGASKLCEKDVVYIRKNFTKTDKGSNVDILCYLFGVGRTAIYSIVNRKRWKHI